jgi:serine phosphatase RsbU (regulator of sigma subunit)/anti-sigma regulatory factor (Ser/Thr protein kinase)
MRFPGIAVLLFLFLFPDLNGQDAAFIIIPGMDHAVLGKHLEILEDPAGSLTINDILSLPYSSQFRKVEQDEPGFGFTSSVYWLKLSIKNSRDEAVDWLLEIAYPPLDYISLYTPGENGGYTVKNTGDRRPFSSREITYRNFVFLLNENPGSSKTYYLRMQSSSSMNFPLNYWQEEAFIKKTDSEQLLLGVYFGSVIIMIVYNIFLFLGFREKSFIYLLLFISAWGFAQLALNGLSFQYLWPDWIWWANINLPFFIFATLAASAQFCRSLLNLQVHLPVWDKILRYQIFLYIVGMFFSLAVSYAVSIRLVSVLTVIVVFSLGMAGISGIKYSRSAVFFLSAWGLFFLGALLFAFKSMGILPGNLITNWGVQIGSFALLFLLSIAVQDRIETEKKAKLKAQQDAVETERRMVASLKESERMLERRVAERTEEINKINILLIDRATELSNLNKIAEKVSSSLHLDNVLQYICEELVRIFEVQSAGIGFLNESRTKFRIAAFHSPNTAEAYINGLEILLADYEASQMVIETKQPFILKNAQNDPRIRSIHDFLKRNNTDSILFIPVLSKNEVTGIIGMPFMFPDYDFDVNKLELARSIAFHVAGFIENARLYEKVEKAKDLAEQDLEIGKQIQSGFFPEKLPSIKGWEFAAHFKAARQVSGDFYDIFRIEKSGITVFVIADVCDKGVGAALFMVLFRSLIRSLSETRLKPGNINEEPLNVINIINSYISRTHGSSNMFASVFYGILDPGTGILYYINAGHEAPVILDSGGNIKERLMPTGPVIGMMPGVIFNTGRILLEEEDIFFGFTDGTTDAKNQDGRFFTEGSVLNSIEREWTSAFSMLFSLNSDISRFTGNQGQYDDITQVAFRRKKKDEEIRQHSICRPAEMEYLENLRDFVEESAVYEGLAKETISDFKLAAEEICVNIMDHGYKEESPGLINIFFILNNGDAILRFTDTGKHFSPWQAKTPDTEAVWEEREIGGLGLHIVKELFDRVEYIKLDDNLNQLTLVKKL